MLTNYGQYYPYFKWCKIVMWANQCTYAHDHGYTKKSVWGHMFGDSTKYSSNMSQTILLTGFHVNT